MSPEAQLRALAKADGWTPPVGDSVLWTKDGGNVWADIQHLPDYLNDTNLMRELWNIKPPPPFTDYFNFNCELAWQLELVLERDFNANPRPWDRPGKLTEWKHLLYSAKHFLFANATAAQLAEPFLKTLGLWTE